MTHIRPRENTVMWQAGALSLLVHAVVFGLLVMSFTLKSVQPMQVAEVELWDSVPVSKPQPPLPKPEPVVEPKPEPQPEPKPEPPPPPEPKAEIQVKLKPPVKVKPAPEKKPKQEKPKEVKPKVDPKVQAKKEGSGIDALKQIMLEEEDPLQAQEREAKELAEARNAQTKAAAASGGALDSATTKIVAKIKRYVNSQVCGSGKPVLEFDVSLMPTGEVVGTPKLVKGSGIPACDQAVERAILQAQPLPVPREPELFAHFRDLNLKFRPNDAH